jgi:hypothetical protein
MPTLVPAFDEQYASRYKDSSFFMTKASSQRRSLVTIQAAKDVTPMPVSLSEAE